jgi:pimeloyl-ACP methyl ester carboxylesterase
MTVMEAADRSETFVPHALEENLVDLGEIRMNYATAGDDDSPALLLIPAQTESWWGYEQAMQPLAARFHVFAVDLRGQGRSTWTPGRYTLDIVGNDVVRFIDMVIALTQGYDRGFLVSAIFAAAGILLVALLISTFESRGHSDAARTLDATPAVD